MTDILEIFVEAARWATLPINPPAGFRLVAFALAPQVPYSERRDYYRARYQGKGTNDAARRANVAKATDARWKVPAWKRGFVERAK